MHSVPTIHDYIVELRRIHHSLVLGQYYGEHAHLHQCRTDAATDVEEEKALPAHSPFEYRAEHKQRKHIEKQMRDVGVHKHIGEYLPYTEARRCRVMQRQEILHTRYRILYQCAERKYDDVDYQ